MHAILLQVMAIGNRFTTTSSVLSLVVRKALGEGLSSIWYYYKIVFSVDLSLEKLSA